MDNMARLTTDQRNGIRDKAFSVEDGLLRVRRMKFNNIEDCNDALDAVREAKEHLRVMENVLMGVMRGQ